MPRGLLETLGLAGTVLFAAPVALLGAELLVRGRTLQGLAFLGIATLMVVVPRRLTTPDDVPVSVVERVVGAVVEEEDDGERES